MAKGDKETIVVNDKEFTIQDPGVRWSLDHDYACKDRNGNLNTTKFIEGILKNVVVDPKDFGIEDFENTQEVGEFLNKIKSFL